MKLLLFLTKTHTNKPSLIKHRHWSAQQRGNETDENPKLVKFIGFVRRIIVFVFSLWSMALLCVYVWCVAAKAYVFRHNSLRNDDLFTRKCIPKSFFTYIRKWKFPVDTVCDCTHSMTVNVIHHCSKAVVGYAEIQLASYAIPKERNILNEMSYAESSETDVRTEKWHFNSS